MRPLVFAALLAGCSADTFGAANDAATDAPEGGSDAGVDARDAADADASTVFSCTSETNALLCDDFERADVLGPWASANETPPGGLSLEPAWTGKALRAHVNGVAGKAMLGRTFGVIASYTFRAVIEVAAAPAGGAVVVSLGGAGEVVELIAYGTTMTLHRGGSLDDSANLGNVSGRHVVAITRDPGGKVIRATVDGAVRASLPLSSANPGALTVGIGVVDPGPLDVETDVRFDDVALLP